MRFHKFRDAVLNKISMKFRLRIVCLWYLISLMAETRKHSLTFASELSGTEKSAFSKFLKNNKDVAKYSLESLSKKQAKIYSKVLEKTKSLPWRVFILIDSTMQNRSSLKSENVQKFNHGKGFVIGHRWTNILLFFNGIIIPLPPIPFYTKKYCRENGLTYMTEHDRVVGYLNDLNLYEYVGFHKDNEVVVLTDSGYDNKKIQNTVLNRGWHFVTALKICRGVKSEARYAKTPKSSGWDGVGLFFKKYRKLAWQTVRILTDGPKRKRKEFRVRHAEVFLKGVGKIRAVCSEFKRKRDGRRKYLACGDLKATLCQILTAYRLRWKIEIFHKHVKMHLGFGDISAKHFSSVESHVSLIYCAYILLNAGLPGIGTDGTIPEKQRRVVKIPENKKTANIIHELTKIGGPDRYKNELKSVLAA
ncbi:transposase [Desulfonema magnum]|uniref:Transposase IS4 domain-containing protein n=1 Tax=Desulfonema magnum TaxID=45655 RepID=A0A975BMD7_9BACT|nr:transposase [Desulfonema magnum]QTA88100.1 Transposase IS4 domain-containing protein [Desulfonema magnum]